MSQSTANISRGSHIGRILVIARHAFTQLVRMKVFYFLAVFAVIAIASNFSICHSMRGRSPSG
jgi:hypothetical protein